MGNTCCSSAVDCSRDLVTDNKDMSYQSAAGNVKEATKNIPDILMRLRKEYDSDVKSREARGLTDESKPDSKGFIHVNRKHDTGTSYVGFMRDGSKNGFGKYTYAEPGYNGQNSYFEGQWKDNKAHGYGMFQDSSGEYRGSWDAGEKNGLGIEKWFEDGTIFRGTYKNGSKDGDGLYEWADGSSYEGQLKANHISGEGKLIDDEGVYIGQFMDNAQHGMGRWQYANGDFYVGQFHDSLRHGEGTLKWTQENKQYSGQWNKGVPHGKGIVTVRNTQKDAYYIMGKSCTKDVWEASQRK